MAEEEEEQEEESPQKKGRGVIQLIVVGAVIALAAIGGLATYMFVIAPMLGEDEASEETASVLDDKIPVLPVTIVLEQTPVNVVREGAGPASMLLFGVTLECNDQETANLVQLHRARFVDIIGKLHDSRTRDELDDVLLIKESIQRQALQKCNDLLERLQEEPAENIRITAVLHHTFVVQDPG